jgi:hypothetical protein
VLASLACTAGKNTRNAVAPYEVAPPGDASPSVAEAAADADQSEPVGVEEACTPLQWGQWGVAFKTGADQGEEVWIWEGTERLPVKLSAWPSSDTEPRPITSSTWPTEGLGRFGDLAVDKTGLPLLLTSIIGRGRSQSFSVVLSRSLSTGSVGIGLRRRDRRRQAQRPSGLDVRVPGGLSPGLLGQPLAGERVTSDRDSARAKARYSPARTGTPSDPAV